KQPVRGARVNIEPLGSKGQGDTDANGWYGASLPSAGKYTVTVSSPGYEKHRKDVSVTDGLNKLTVTLKREQPPKKHPAGSGGKEPKTGNMSPTRLIVLVQEAGGPKPLRSAKVRLQFAGRKLEGDTDAKGSWVVPEPVPGRCTVNVTAPGFESKQEELTLKPG